MFALTLVLFLVSVPAVLCESAAIGVVGFSSSRIVRIGCYGTLVLVVLEAVLVAGLGHVANSFPVNVWGTVADGVLWYLKWVLALAAIGFTGGFLVFNLGSLVQFVAFIVCLMAHKQ